MLGNLGFTALDSKSQACTKGPLHSAFWGMFFFGGGRENFELQCFTEESRDLLAWILGPISWLLFWGLIPGIKILNVSPFQLKRGESPCVVCLQTEWDFCLLNLVFVLETSRDRSGDLKSMQLSSVNPSVDLGLIGPYLFKTQRDNKQHRT